jgi:hypothetical protein
LCVDVQNVYKVKKGEDVFEEKVGAHQIELWF